MIPLCLVTGFLGSGKTTLLGRLRAEAHGRVACIVNECTGRDVDAHVLGAGPGEVLALPGGSIFCRCLAGELIALLGRLAARAAPPPDGVIIEASGIADPRVVGDLLREPALAGIYRLANVITVIDPPSFLKLLSTLAAVRAQVQAASLVLVNKVDCCPGDAAARAEAAVRELAPRAKVLRTAFCAAPIEVFPPGDAAADLHGPYAPCRDAAFAPRVVCVPGQVDLAQLREGLARLAGELYRAKGFVRAGGRRWHVDFSASGATLAPVDDDGPTHLAFILRGEPSPAARAFLAGLGEEEKR